MYAADNPGTKQGGAPGKANGGKKAMAANFSGFGRGELTDAELDQVSGGTTFNVATPKELASHTASDNAAIGLAKAGADGGDHGVTILG